MFQFWNETRDKMAEQAKLLSPPPCLTILIEFVGLKMASKADTKWIHVVCICCEDRSAGTVTEQIYSWRGETDEANAAASWCSGQGNFIYTYIKTNKSAFINNYETKCPRNQNWVVSLNS